MSYKKTLEVQKRFGAGHDAKTKEWASQMYLDRLKETELVEKLNDSVSEEATKELEMHRMGSILKLNWWGTMLTYHRRQSSCQRPLSTQQKVPTQHKTPYFADKPQATCAIKKY